MWRSSSLGVSLYTECNLLNSEEMRICTWLNEAKKEKKQKQKQKIIAIGKTESAAQKKGNDGREVLRITS